MAPTLPVRIVGSDAPLEIASVAGEPLESGLVDHLGNPITAWNPLPVGASAETSQIMNGRTPLVPQFAPIDVTTLGDNTLVGASAGDHIRVLSVYLIASGTTTVRFESGASGTALSGQLALTAQAGFVLPFSPVGWFETASGQLLNLELSAGVSVDGGLVYVLVQA